MMQSSTKKEYWCLFIGDQVALVKDSLIFNESVHEKIKIHKLLDQADLVVYCAEINTSHALSKEYTFIPLKKALDTLDPQWYGIATKAFAVLNWDKNHQFCGRCGAVLRDHQAHNPLAFERECPNCQLLFYPRISPSVIVRIRKGDKILMARSPHFPPGAFGLIAGFVEAGESLEEAVHREVQEEVGIRINNLHYFGSQPWPFPDSLMVGFTADYQSGELVIDKTELEQAGWYRYDKLPGRPSTRTSISTKLIDDFIQSH